MESLILVGGGGHCRSCIDVIEHSKRFRIQGILDLPGKLGSSVLGYPCIGTDEDFSVLANKGFKFLVTVGQIESSAARGKIYDQLMGLGAQLATIISPRAYVSPHASIGPGTIVMHDALINAGVSVEENCIVNSKALIEHDATIERHCHVSTAAVVNGGVRLAEGTFYGSNAVSKEYVESTPGEFIKAGTLFLGNTKS